MAGILKVYGLGTMGVNVDSDPLSLQDQELRKAQNAIRDPLGTDSGLRKRPGLAVFNTTTLNDPFADQTLELEYWDQVSVDDQRGIEYTAQVTEADQLGLDDPSVVLGGIGVLMTDRSAGGSHFVLIGRGLI